MYYSSPGNYSLDRPLPIVRRGMESSADKETREMQLLTREPGPVSLHLLGVLMTRPRRATSPRRSGDCLP